MPALPRSEPHDATTPWWRHPRWVVVRVGSGFSWGAFAFGALWAMAHRGGARLVGALLLLDALSWVATGWLEAQPDAVWQALGSAVDLGVALWQGWRGQAWLRSAYLRQGAGPA